MSDENPAPIIRQRIAQHMPFVVFGCVWFAVCALAVVMISRGDFEYKRCAALVQSGAVQKESLYIAAITEGDDHGYQVELSKTYPKPLSIEVNHFASSDEGLQVGQAIDAYRIDGKYFVPRLRQEPVWWDKLLFAGVGIIVPLMVITGTVLQYRWLAKKKVTLERSGVKFVDVDDPENHIFGRDTFDMPMPVTEDDTYYFRIVPKKLDTRGLVTFCVWMTAFFGTCFVIARIAEPEASHWFTAPFLLIGVLTCVFGVRFELDTRRKQQRLGAVLIYDKRFREIYLPRQKKKFDLDEVIHLQSITTRLPGDKTIINTEQLSELNIVVKRNGVRKRFPLLCSCDTLNPFHEILLPLVRSTPIPVVVVTEELMTGDITEVPFASDRQTRD